MNNLTSPFGIFPFSAEAELEEVGRRLPGGARSFPLSRPGPSRMPSSTPSTLRRGPYRPVRSHGLGLWASPPEGGSAPAAGALPSEQIRWVQYVLNGALGINLPVDGLVSSDLRAALRDFQRRQGLPISGFIGPDTIDALRRAGEQPSGEEGQARELEVAGEGELPGPALMAENALADRSKAHSVDGALKILAGAPTRGLYRFIHPRRGFYTGMSTDLRRRILDHVLCLSHFGMSPKPWLITLYPMPGISEPSIRAVEKAINEHHKMLGSKMLNKNKELELLEFGFI